ncbi:MAG TPA: sporulation protein [Pseudonocardiaceae bacterium]
MDVKELMAQARDTMDGRRVFGEPVREDGLTVIPAAKVRGGGGGGGGGDGESSGDGGGFGLLSGPAGAIVIKDGDVAWRPAVDVNRIVLGGQLVAVVALLVLRSVLRHRASGRR